MIDFAVDVGQPRRTWLRRGAITSRNFRGFFRWGKDLMPPPMPLWAMACWAREWPGSHLARNLHFESSLDCRSCCKTYLSVYLADQLVLKLLCSFCVLPQNRL